MTKRQHLKCKAERILRQRITGDRRVAPAGVSDTDHSGQGSPRENDEEQDQRVCRLLGYGDAAVSADGECIRGGILD